MVVSSLFLTSFSKEVQAGKAGVGILNVAPKYGMIKIINLGDQIRVELNISDYNSWSDIYKVKVLLEGDGEEIATFLYKQYESEDKWEKINEFSEIGNKDLLVKEKCLFLRSLDKETVDQRCDIEIRFVFKNTWFTRINIVVSDRFGSESKSHIDYNPSGAVETSNIILIPWFDGFIKISYPDYLPEFLAIIAGMIGVYISLREKELILLKIGRK